MCLRTGSIEKGNGYSGAIKVKAKCKHNHRISHEKPEAKTPEISNFPSALALYSGVWSTPSFCRYNPGKEIRYQFYLCRRGVHRVLVGEPEGKRPLGRPRRRWEDNIMMDLQEVGGSCEDWMELAQDRDRWRALVSTVMKLGVPKMRGISWLAAEPVNFSRRTLLHGVSKESKVL